LLPKTPKPHINSIIKLGVPQHHVVLQQLH